MSPVTFQLKPKRGETCRLPVGTSEVLRPNCVTTSGFSSGLSKNTGLSKRTPRLKFKFGVAV